MFLRCRTTTFKPPALAHLVYLRAFPSRHLAIVSRTNKNGKWNEGFSSPKGRRWSKNVEAIFAGLPCHLTCQFEVSLASLPASTFASADNDNSSRQLQRRFHFNIPGRHLQPTPPNTTVRATDSEMRQTEPAKRRHVQTAGNDLAVLVLGDGIMIRHFPCAKVADGC